MIIISTIIIASQTICFVQGLMILNTISTKPTYKSSNNKNIRDPLILTPYIESGNIEEGKRLASVPFTERLNIKSYAGYFTVNKQYDSNMFFWYFPAMASDQKAPVVTWLQGGPGASSMIGLFEENGPITVVNNTIKGRSHHWALNHHMIYIDNPVGTGFSYTNSTEGYCTNEVQVGEQLYSVMVQFFQLFPELQQNKYFATGESYAGKYVPALAYTIHKNNPEAKIKINLEGIAIGNGFTDPINMLVYDEYLYELGLVDWNTAKTISKYQDKARKLIKLKQFKKAMAYRYLILREINVDIYNYLLPKKEDMNFGNFMGIFDNASIRKDLHVTENLSYHVINNKVYDYLSYDILQSVAPWVSELLEHYSVLTYNGQLDIIVAYPLTVNYLRKLNFTGAEEYKTAKRHIWKVDNDIAGFVKQAGNLTEVMVRDASHTVPKDQPKWALDLITRFTHNKPFY